MKTLLISLAYLTILAQGFAGPPLQLEDTRGFRPFSHNRLRPDYSSTNNVISPYYVLPATVIPERYVLRIRPALYEYAGDAQEYTAPGDVEITIKCVTETNQIVIHKHPTLNITTSSIRVTDSNSGPINVLGTTYVELHHFFNISLQSNLVANETYRLSMDFVAPIPETMEGLYRAQFTDGTETKRMATTQFEPVSARQAFPCFDEPDMRATFKISIARRKVGDFIALSNERIEQLGVDDPARPDWVWDHFAETISMPTYLVALIVAEGYSGVFDTTTFNKPVGVYGPRHLIDTPTSSGQFAVDASANIINFLQQKYQEPYSLSKIDSIAIPTGYFSAGAMENWGLNTYRQEYLLFLNGESSELNRYRIASILTHELAHQWFGNLVTCKWWSELWLNEGFATYISFLGINQFFPEFDALREIQWDSVQYSLNYDVDRDEPVRNHAISPEQIDQIFSTITYDKGASIIRMLEGVMTEANLTSALATYLNQYQFKGAEQDNLFQVLTDVAVQNGRIPAGKTIKGIMDTWTLEAGFPLIRVSKVGGSHIYISQERFTKISSPGNITRNGFWEVPISISTQDDAEFSVHTPKLWLDKNSLSRSYTHDTSKWLIVNPDGTGFYRVMYDPEILQLIIAQLALDRTAISGLSRSQLIDDYFSLAKNGYVSISTALDLTIYLAQEDDRVVWNSFFSGMTKALTLFRNEDVSALRNYLVPRIEAALGRTQWDQPALEQGAVVLFRAKLLDWACALESSGCMDKARALLLQWQTTPDVNPVPLDIQPVMYCAIAANGGEPAFDFLLGQVNNPTTSAFQKTRLITALACSKDLGSLQGLLDMALTSTGDIGQNTGLVLQRVALNSAGRRIAFDFMRLNFQALKEKTGGVSAVVNAITSLSTVYTKESEKGNVQQVIAENEADLQGVQGSLQTALRNIDDNIAWINEFYPEMNTWFNAH